MLRSPQRALAPLFLLLAAACGETTTPPGLTDGAPLTFSPVYEAVDFTSGPDRKDWIPMDITVATTGTLWVIQRAERAGGFTDDDECTTMGLQGLRPQDCAGLFGSTVEIFDPTVEGMATEGNGRAELIKDPNDWHFMRRPAGIAFGEEEITLPEGDPGMGTLPLLEGDQTFGDTFATCHEHWTGNPTDQPPFIGPSLWTADEDVYDSVRGTERYGEFNWSNGDHLDMVHGTGYCVGIAWEGAGNVYWLFNGELGSLDRYDFGNPHLPGADYHLDATIDRYSWSTNGITRLPNVPSNMEMDGGTLYVSDSGNGRILSIDTNSDATDIGNFTTPDPIQGDWFEDLDTIELASRSTLEAEWGSTVEPSGLAILDEETLVVANHGSGHITFLSRADGTVLRTVDTELGAGIGGLTVFEGNVYFVHINDRMIYRVDVVVEE